MTKKSKALVLAIAFAFVCLVGFATRVHSTASTEWKGLAIIAPAPAFQPKRPQLTHQQQVWVSALEWCESRGIETAINPKDRDDTPSYYSLQFKPGTFLSFGILYGVLPKATTLKDVKDTLIKDTGLQRDIAGFMLLDTSLDLSGQFPDCVRKLGLPDRTSR